MTGEMSIFLPVNKILNSLMGHFFNQTLLEDCNLQQIPTIMFYNRDIILPNFTFSATVLCSRSTETQICVVHLPYVRLFYISSTPSIHPCQDFYPMNRFLEYYGVSKPESGNFHSKGGINTMQLKGDYSRAQFQGDFFLLDYFVKVHGNQSERG